VICETLDAEIKKTFSILRQCYSDQLWRAANHNTYDLSCQCHVPISTACCTSLCDYNPPTLETDRRTEGRHARSISER